MGWRFNRCLPGAAAVFCATLAFAIPSWAQMDSREAIALQNQVLELRRDIQALQAQIGRGGATASPGPSYLAPRPSPPPSGGSGGAEITAQLLGRVQTLEEQVRQLRGQIDEVTNQTQRQNAEMAKQIGDLKFSLQSGGGGSPGPNQSPPSSTLPSGRASAPAASPPPASPPAASAPPPASPSGPPVRRTPEIALQEGHAALARRDYAAAEASAREVLQGSRTSPRAYDAQFLLAQALAGQRNFAQAAIAYDDTYTRSKTGSHAGDALVGLAASLTSIGEKRAACETLNKLNAEFPRQSADVRDAATGVRQRAGCR